MDSVFRSRNYTTGFTNLYIFHPIYARARIEIAHKYFSYQ